MAPRASRSRPDGGIDKGTESPGRCQSVRQGRTERMETLMQIPLQITFHGVDHSDAVETRIREKVAKLEHLFDRITSCRVVIEQHHKNTSNLHHKGEPFHIRLALTVPGDELVVKRDPKDSHVNEDIYVALREAFAGMERQLKEYVDRSRGNVKARANA
ncbi:hypothetical protein amb4342 [Paramagnetospirillum magneticum AMB-1]|uniref:Ribosomal subunit interface protein n=2 Tax=Paramagnetospirillum TaxID=3031148 RepID=Q2VZ29_PARM1|nr:hypothetical protein amb4342 [Paramagnetospirillum magneticum AMB-1]